MWCKVLASLGWMFFFALKVSAKEEVFGNAQYQCHKMQLRQISSFDPHYFALNKKISEKNFNVVITNFGKSNMAYFFPGEFYLKSGWHNLTLENYPGLTSICKQTSMVCFKSLIDVQNQDWNLFIVPRVNEGVVGPFALALDTKDISKAGVCLSTRRNWGNALIQEKEAVNNFLNEIASSVEIDLNQRTTAIIDAREQMADSFNQLSWFEQQKVVDTAIVAVATIGIIGAYYSNILTKTVATRISLALLLALTANQLNNSETLEYYLTKDGTDFWLNGDKALAQWAIDTYPQLVLYFESIKDQLSKQSNPLLKER